MATSLDTFAARLIKHVPSCPAFAIKPEVLETIQDFCRKTWAIKRTFEYQLTSAAVNTYINKSVIIYLNQVFPNHRPVGVAALLIDGTPYELERMDTHGNISEIKDPGPNRKYYEIPSAQQVRFFPFDLADCRLVMEIAFAPLDLASSVPDVLYRDHFEAIKAGALARLHDIPNRDWTDHALAAKRKREYESASGGVVVQRQYTEHGRGKPKRKSFI
jgi:hypothetical protein